MNLSKNITLAEMTKSQTAIRHGITNEPTHDHVVNMKLLAKMVLQPIRDFFNKPLIISSGYRSFELNKIIKGSLKSQHMTGSACDIDVETVKVLTNQEILYYIAGSLDFDQLIWEFGDDNEPSWVHVSYVSPDSNRGEILKAYKVGGKTFYKIFTF